MILLGITDGEDVVASIAHYDCRTYKDLMMDGGQPFVAKSTGYNRYSVVDGHRLIWFRVPQTYADLYYDYNCNRGKRKYGIWKYSDVELLDEEYVHSLDIEEMRLQNAIWGTYGKDGKSDLKYVHLVDCDSDHLKAIVDLRHTSGEIVGYINEILKRREEDKN